MHAAAVHNSLPVERHRSPRNQPHGRNPKSNVILGSGARLMRNATERDAIVSFFCFPPRKRIQYGGGNPGNYYMTLLPPPPNHPSTRLTNAPSAVRRPASVR
jgi:hypothetical protein